MQGSAIILRHSKLAPPYHDYEKLSIENLDDLAMGRVDPEIDIDFTNRRLDQLRQSLLKGAHPTAIYHAPSRRARQSAECLASTLGVGKVEEKQFLGEILFSPQKLISEDEFIKDGMTLLRERLYDSLEEDRGVESQTSMRARIGEVRSTVDRHANETIIIVTHGFFMKLLHNSLVCNLDAFALNEDDRRTGFSYLDGFTLA